MKHKTKELERKTNRVHAQATVDDDNHSEMYARKKETHIETVRNKQTFSTHTHTRGQRPEDAWRLDFEREKNPNETNNLK